MDGKDIRAKYAPKMWGDGDEEESGGRGENGEWKNRVCVCERERERKLKKEREKDAKLSSAIHIFILLLFGSYLEEWREGEGEEREGKRERGRELKRNRILCPFISHVNVQTHGSYASFFLPLHLFCFHNSFSLPKFHSLPLSLE